LLASPLCSLLGCDVALIALLFANNKNSKSSSPAAAAPDTTYTLYVANFATPAAAAAEATNLNTNGGNPTSPPWTIVGSATATEIWNALPPSMNAAMIRGPLTQVYNIDTFESLDANDAVIEVPTAGNVYANSTVSVPLSNASGMLDGVAVTTLITDPAHIPCVFALFTHPLTSLRVRIWGAAQTSGDCVWSNHDELANTDTYFVGGAATDSAGVLYAPYVDGTLKSAFYLSFTAGGTKNSATAVGSPGTTTATGGISAAVDSSGNLFIANNLGTGNIQVQKYAAGALGAAQWPFLYTGISAGGANVVASHGLAVASGVPLISSPGSQGTAVFLASGQGTAGSHTLVRIDDTPNGASFLPAQEWIPPQAIADPSSKATSWSAVATSGSTSVLTTGDLSNSVSGNIEIFTQNTSLGSATGAVVWPSPMPTTTGGGQATNNGNAVGADGQGFVYVAGNFGSAANGRDSVLLRYKISDGTGLTTLYKNSTFTGANEFLGIAVDTDGTAYVVGYVTLSDLISTTAVAPTTSMWIGRFPPGGAIPLWTATFNAGTGNDQAISVSLSGTYVYVTGQETVPSPKTGMRVFKFLK
jgi:hypothetical protein